MSHFDGNLTKTSQIYGFKSLSTSVIAFKIQVSISQIGKNSDLMGDTNSIS